MINPKDIHPLTEFKRDTAKFIANLEKIGRPHVLTVDGRPKVVLLTVSAFEKLVSASESRMESNSQESIRFQETAALSDLAIQMMEQNIKRKFPKASSYEIKEHLSTWLHDRPQVDYPNSAVPISQERLRRLKGE